MLKALVPVTAALVLSVSALAAQAKDLNSVGIIVGPLGNPFYVALAKGMGMGATRVATAEDLCRALERGLAEPGPTLIEAQL